jgi:Na+/proline symporter
MTIGLSPLDIAVIVVYFVMIMWIGLRSARSVKTTGDFFMGGRRFGKLLMVAKAFGVGSRVDHVVAVTGASYQVGLAGVWYQWLYIFANPFFWIITPIYRRLRYVTTGDFFEQRYGRAAGGAYTVAAMMYFAVEIGMVLRGTGTTVEAISRGSLQAEWVILCSTLVFVGYSAAGGLVSAVSTKILQGSMLLLLSLLPIPFALSAVGGFGGLHERLPREMFDLFSGQEITPYFIAMITINGLVGIVAMPHHMAMGGAAKSEISSRTGWTYGNIVKRFATLAWAFIGVMALALYPGLAGGEREQALGIVLLNLLPAGLLGLMIAAMVASLMAVCDTYMVDGSALYTRNVHRVFSRKTLAEKKEMTIARISSIVIAASGVVVAFLLQDVVSGLKIVWKIMAFLGLPFWMAVIWPRGNRYGLWSSLAVTTGIAAYTDAMGWGLADQIAVYLPAGFLTFIAASALTPAEPDERLRSFYTLLHTPVGEEWRLREAGVEIMMGGGSVQPTGTEGKTNLEESGHSLILVDLLSLHKKFSFRRYRVDLVGFTAALVLILGIIGLGVFLSGIGG